MKLSLKKLLKEIQTSQLEPWVLNMTREQMIEVLLDHNVYSPEEAQQMSDDQLRQIMQDWANDYD